MSNIGEELSPEEIAELTDAGAVIVDLRPPEEFGREHLAGAVNLSFSMRRLSDRLHAVLPAATRVVLIGSDPVALDHARAQLTAGGFSVSGSVAGGFQGWKDSGRPVTSLRQLPVDVLQRTEAEDVVVLDVREPLEWETGHVPGAILIPLGAIRTRIASIPRDTMIAVICEAGIRSSTAASILIAGGLQGVANVPEGTAGYRNRGFPLDYPQPE